jgi:hypothetical protein
MKLDERYHEFARDDSYTRRAARVAALRAKIL